MLWRTPQVMSMSNGITSFYFFLTGFNNFPHRENFENIFVVQQDCVVKFLYGVHLSDKYFPPSTVGLYYIAWSLMVVM